MKIPRLLLVHYFVLNVDTPVGGPFRRSLHSKLNMQGNGRNYANLQLNLDGYMMMTFVLHRLFDVFSANRASQLEFLKTLEGEVLLPVCLPI